MARIFAVTLSLAVLLTSVAIGQTPSERLLHRIDEADSAAQVDSLRREAAEIEAKIVELNAQIAARQNRRAELLQNLKAAHDRVAELRGTTAGAKPPLLFPVSIERAMLGDGQPALPRTLKRYQLVLPDRDPPEIPRPKR